jgi:hypothetical protein
LIESHYGVTIRDPLRQASQEHVTLITLENAHDFTQHDSAGLMRTLPAKSMRESDTMWKNNGSDASSIAILMLGTSELPRFVDVPCFNHVRFRC